MHELRQNETPGLMRDYVEHGDEGAFRELVERYLPVVFGAALRRCHGQRSLAEEVTQEVFTKFAQRMPRLKADERVGAWLHRAATFRAGDLMRSEQRRKKREHLAAAMIELDNLPEVDAWNQVAPVIDEAMARLRGRDREILVSHYLEGVTLKRLSESLSISEVAVRKRVQRALGRLRDKLSGQQVAISAVTLTTVLSTRTATAGTFATKELADTVASQALSSPAAPVFGLPFLGDVGLGVIATLVVGAVPLIWSGQETLEETSSAAASVVPSKRVRVAAPVHQLAIQPKKKEPETLEEIVVALGELLSRPNSKLDIARRELLAERIRSEQAGEALTLMDRLWSEDVSFRLEHRDFTGGNPMAPKRMDLFQQWADQEPKAAFDWVLAAHRNDALFKDRFGWEGAIEVSLKRWAEDDLPAVLSWTQSAIESKALSRHREARFTQAIAEVICPLVYHLEGARSSVSWMVKLEETKLSSGIGGLIFNNADEFKSSQDFLLAMEVVEEEVDSPTRRRAFRGIMLRYWKQVNWQDSLAWVRSRSGLGNQAEMELMLGFPPEFPPGFDIGKHADSLQRLTIITGNDDYHSAVGAVMRRWFPMEPMAAAEWILANNALTKGAVDDLLRAIPKTEQFREASMILIHKAKELFPKQFEKYVKGRPAGLLNPLIKEGAQP